MVANVHKLNWCLGGWVKGVWVVKVECVEGSFDRINKIIRIELGSLAILRFALETRHLAASVGQMRRECMRTTTTIHSPPLTRLEAASPIFSCVSWLKN